MATNSMIPVANAGGVNQTSPAMITPTANPVTPVSTAVGPTNSPLSAPVVAQQNPLVPSAVPTTGVPNAGSVATNATDSSKQFTDIYGKGIGTDIENLLTNIGGVDSATLQEYQASLVPQEAKASANLGASLGAAGVSANSSVAALGQANLQAQETADIAGESANLTQSGQQLEANILTGTENAASQEVAESGWDVFGQVVSGIGKDAGSVLSALGDAGDL